MEGVREARRNERGPATLRRLGFAAIVLVGSIFVVPALATAQTATTPAPAPATTAPSQPTPAPTSAATKAALEADTNDGEATRKVNTVVAALAALGLLFAGLVVWYWRSTRPVPPHLEGLELMASRRFLRADESTRQALLGAIDAARPGSAAAEILPGTVLLDDGHVGDLDGAEDDDNVATPHRIPGGNGLTPPADVETELGRSHGAPFVTPPSYPASYPPPSMEPPRQPVHVRAFLPPRIEDSPDHQEPNHG